MPAQTTQVRSQTICGSRSFHLTSSTVPSYLRITTKNWKSGISFDSRVFFAGSLSSMVLYLQKQFTGVSEKLTDEVKDIFRTIHKLIGTISYSKHRNVVERVSTHSTREWNQKINQINMRISKKYKKIIINSNQIALNKVVFVCEGRAFNHQWKLLIIEILVLSHNKLVFQKNVNLMCPPIQVNLQKWMIITEMLCRGPLVGDI